MRLPVYSSYTTFCPVCRLSSCPVCKATEASSGTKTKWPTDRRSQCNLKFNLRQYTANYRPLLSSERAPYMKIKESNCHSNVTSGHLLQEGWDTKTNWPTDRRSQCNLKLNLRHCTANYRPVLSSERAPYMKNKPNVWSPAPRRARHQDELAYWPSVVMRLRLRLRLPGWPLTFV
jgi:hypothetical protein